MLNKLTSTLALLRPRHIARLTHRIAQLGDSLDALRRSIEQLDDRVQARIDQQAEDLRRGPLRDFQKAVAELARDSARAEKRRAALLDEQAAAIGEIRGRIERVSSDLVEASGAVSKLSRNINTQERRSEQLVQLQISNWKHRDVVRRVAEVFSSPETIDHVRSVVGGTLISESPFPHAVLEGLLPEAAYGHIVAALPPRVFFEDQPLNKQQLKVPFSFAPDYTTVAWGHFNALIEDVIGPALEARFRSHLNDYVERICPGLAATDARPITFKISDGRVMLRRPGYVIAPHRDPKWGFLTVLLYLARSQDREAYGTQLYSVRSDGEAPIASPFYVEPQLCELVREVPFRKNTALVFLNSEGAHGACIPADAPPDVERYLFQFRIGPDGDSMRRLVDAMSPEKRGLWIGSKTDKIGFSETY